MSKAPHSSRIKLCALDEGARAFEIPMRNLKTAFQELVSEMVGFGKADSWCAVLLIIGMDNANAILVLTLASESTAQRTKYPLRRPKDWFSLTL